MLGVTKNQEIIIETPDGEKISVFVKPDRGRDNYKVAIDAPKAFGITRGEVKKPSCGEFEESDEDRELLNRIFGQ